MNQNSGSRQHTAHRVPSSVSPGVAGTGARGAWRAGGAAAGSGASESAVLALGRSAGPTSAPPFFFRFASWIASSAASDPVTTFASFTARFVSDRLARIRAVHCWRSRASRSCRRFCSSTSCTFFSCSSRTLSLASSRARWASAALAAARACWSFSRCSFSASLAIWRSRSRRISSARAAASCRILASKSAMAAGQVGGG
mmetsp:Transcript_9024/g.19715  ORF Transcript_9024/g.19715 Transcript_9024/m.19715 type:complete len:200 (+) Transcript_9024:1169-1768(+)